MATRSPALVGNLDQGVDGLSHRHHAFFDVVAVHDIHPARPAGGVDGSGGDEHRGRRGELLKARGGEKTRLQLVSSVRDDGFDRQRPLIRFQRGRDVANLARELAVRVGVDFERDRLADGHGRMTCSGTVNCARNGLTRTTTATLVPRVT